MIKTFTWTRPDEPYKTAATGTRTIEITYKGTKYHLVEVEKRTGTGAIVGSADDLNDSALSKDRFPDKEKYEYVIIDADTMPGLASALTLSYTHPDPNDWTETLTDADGETFTWEHNYDETTGLIEHETTGVNGGYVFNVSTQSWEGPEFRTHMTDPTETLAGWAAQAQELQTALDNAENLELTDAQIAEITAYKNFLESIPVKYAGIDHWKIPFTLDWPEF